MCGLPDVISNRNYQLPRSSCLVHYAACSSGQRPAPPRRSWRVTPTCGGGGNPCPGACRYWRPKWPATACKECKGRASEHASRLSKVSKLGMPPNLPAAGARIIEPCSATMAVQHNFACSPQFKGVQLTEALMHAFSAWLDVQCYRRCRAASRGLKGRRISAKLDAI